jgi:hypothetical protein
MNRLLGASLLLVLGTACNVEDEPPVEEPAPTCATGQVSYSGTLNTIPVNETHTVTGHVLQNTDGATGDGTLSVTGPDGDLRIVFDTHLSPDSSVPAAITLDFDQPTTVKLGNCATLSLPSTVSLDSDGQGGKFTVRAMVSSPACSSEEPLEGELTGCFRFE